MHQGWVMLHIMYKHREVIRQIEIINTTIILHQLNSDKHVSSVVILSSSAFDIGSTVALERTCLKASYLFCSSHPQWKLLLAAKLECVLLTVEFVTSLRSHKMQYFPYILLRGSYLYSNVYISQMYRTVKDT